MVKKMCKVCKKEARYLVFIKGTLNNLCLEHSKRIEKEFGEIEPLTKLFNIIFNFWRFKRLKENSRQIEKYHIQIEKKPW